MTVQVLAPRDVQSTLNYYAPLDTQPPYNYVDAPPAGVAKTNVGEDTRPVVVHDARGKGDSLGLDVSGFQFVHHPSVEKDFVDEDKIKSVYYPEVEEVLKKHTGAKRVFIFDHTIRRNPADQKGVSNAAVPGLRGPVVSGVPLLVCIHSHSQPQQRVHVDQTFAAAAERVHRHLGDEAERLLKGRYRIINVWRYVPYPLLTKYPLIRFLDPLPTPWHTNLLP